MNKLSMIASRITAAAVSLGALASTVMAEAYDYGYDYYYDSSAGDALGAGVGGVMLLVYCCMCLIGALSLGLWVWMLIDVLKRTETELPDKTTWIIIIVLLGGIGALVYYFSKKRALDAKKK